ncbi:hypothetical protein H1R20_g26, partial [Candolleomyces eurysporus]
MSSESTLKEIIVLGAGVVGLSTALKVQETGRYKVTIVAEVLPTDPKTIKYTSQWAGAHHVSFASLDDPRHALDKETFDELWKLKDSVEGCFMTIRQTEYFSKRRASPSPLAHMPEFRSLSPSELGALENIQATNGEAFTTFSFDTPVYLTYLSTRFLSKGGRIIRGSVQHISEIAESGVFSFLSHEEKKHVISKPNSIKPPAAIVVCVGLGARFLGGVEDKDVYPIRGQTVLVNAPWIKHGKTLSDLDAQEWTYMIPRKSGTVILGGTLEPDDWNPTPRPETTQSILERVLKLAPELVPGKANPTVEDIWPIVIEEGCGFRPGRKGGLRLEAGEVQVPHTDKTIPVVYNYGHAGSGYIASFGSGRVALDLLEKALKQ